jgi:hypothetical protein
MDLGAPMKGESAKQNLLRHPAQSDFQRRAREAEERASRRWVVLMALVILSVYVLMLAGMAWVVMG